MQSAEEHHFCEISMTTYERTPSEGNTSQDERVLACEDIFWYKRIVGDFELNVQKGREEETTEDQSDDDIGIIPADDWRLVPGEIEENQGGDTSRST
jgi:hypothetical protein